ncbi:Chromosome partitioning protein parA [Lacticaseibacillus sharpeae JCM 1186 = DSM 20505]|uniref:Chromosome partitioning protein parA n=1 Tax=Lacticaseibacillus sharpeae JCM 1186 = DSM 20505 TaxID=1291052 RepID=A0A0R1ZPQ1_9LACO|nr:Chromosome partitioning protein parA [Lacticaseibacillus sharpeae JCM 1186 = DSM 20505]
MKLKRPLTITVANAKGGVGKTTITRYLPFVLAERGYKVLVVDADPQGNLTKTMGITKQRYEPDKVFVMEKSMMAAVVEQDLGSAIVNVVPNLDEIPSNVDWGSFPTYLAKRFGLAEKGDPDYYEVESKKIVVLKNLLAPIKGNYDFIFIDTPPTPASQWIRNATVASDWVIIAFQTQSDSLDGAKLFRDNDLRELIEDFGADTDVLGILPNQVSNSGAIDQIVIEDAIEIFGEQNLFQHIIPFAKRIQSAPRIGLTREGYWNSRLFNDVIDPLADDFLERLKIVGEIEDGE